MPIRSAAVIFLCLSLILTCAGVAFAKKIINISLTNDRWPDSSTMRAFALDAGRLMGAQTEEEKALAVFHFIRMFTARTDGKVPREPALGNIYIDDPLKVLNVYGAHHCDGLTRVMELAWRSLPGQAEKLFRSGHTQADIYWMDSDGVDRGHLFDVSEGWYVYDRTGRRIAGADDIALDYSLIFRPSVGPVPRRPHYWGMWNWIHAPQLPPAKYDKRFSLRSNERFTRFWGNMDLPYQDNFAANGETDLEHGPYPVTFGNGVLEYSPDLTDPDILEEVVNLALPSSDSALSGLHPTVRGKPAEIIFKTALPYVIADAWLDGTFWRQQSADILVIALSTDQGRTWKEIWQADGTGRIDMKKMSLARKFDLYQSMPKTITPFGRYEYWIKIQMLAAHDPESVGVDELTITTITQHNIFSLPMLWPGTNTMTVSAELPKDLALQVTLVWDDLEGKKNRHAATVQQTPFSYPVLTSGRRWEDVRGISFAMEAAPRTGNDSQGADVQQKPRIFQEIRPIQAFNTSAIVGSRMPPPLKTVSDYMADLKDPKKQVQALSGLMVHRDKTSLNAVKEVAFQSISHPQKDMAVQALYLISPDQSLPVLLQILKRSPEVRWKTDLENKFVELGHWYNIAALIGVQMADAGIQAAVVPLMGVLQSVLDNKDKGWQPHASIIRSLSRLGDSRAATVIRPFLDHNPDVAAAASKALSELNSGINPEKN